MSVREAVDISAGGSARATAAARVGAGSLSRAGHLGRTRPDVRRRARVSGRQRPVTAPISVTYGQHVAAGCAEPAVESPGYWMGRWARLSVTASVLVAGLILLITSLVGSSEMVLQQFTVSSGDTLWSIAESIAPSADADDVVEQIIAVNQLASLDLPIGMVLQIPVAS